MSPRTWVERIIDILDAIAEIQTFMHGLDFDTFRSDPKTIRAIELEFIIIGEAATQIPEEAEEKHPEVPWHLMRAMRNRLVHVYFSIDPKLLWDTIQNDLPALIEPLNMIVRDNIKGTSK